MALKQAMTPEFKEYAAQVIKNAQALSKILQKKGNNRDLIMFYLKVIFISYYQNVL